jgi:hypothetical protein
MLWFGWARKDSNLRSPDPESADRFSRFFACREHETNRFLPRILPSLVTYRKRGQVATSGLPDSLTRTAKATATVGRREVRSPECRERTIGAPVQQLIVVRVLVPNQD